MSYIDHTIYFSSFDGNIVSVGKKVGNKENAGATINDFQDNEQIPSVINALEIDWNGANLGDISTEFPNIHSTGQLLKAILSVSQNAGGARGPQGFQGPRGYQGAQGAQGVKGPQGVIGTDGPKGNTGPQGLPGPQGPQGPAGKVTVIDTTGNVIEGAQGAQGPQGPRGYQGVQGAKGETVYISGAQGGVQGPQGPQGRTGAIGPQGPAGASGNEEDLADYYKKIDLLGEWDTSNGFMYWAAFGSDDLHKFVSKRKLDQYATLNSLNELATRVNALAGAQGGAQGPQGARGLSGAQGPQGVQGARGYQGAKGETVYISGAQGGAQGPQGRQGAQGPQGPAGQGIEQSDINEIISHIEESEQVISQALESLNSRVSIIEQYLGIQYNG